MIKHIPEVKAAIGAEGIRVLEEVFSATSSDSVGISAPRFRADHRDWIPILDRLENSGIMLERLRDHSEYRVKLFALPLISSPQAKALLEIMDAVFPILQNLYVTHLNKPFTVSELANAVATPEKELRACFTYMLDAHGWWGGHSGRFPSTADSTLVLAEGIITHEAFSALITQVYEWHYVNVRAHVPSFENLLHPSTQQAADGFFASERRTGALPEWYSQLDPTMQAIIGEVDRALSSNLVSLPTIGLRTIIDLVMTDKGFANGTFEKRLREFASAGWVATQHKSVLDAVLDAGNASAHRAYFPSSDDLRTCVEVVKHLLHGVYILAPKATAVRENTPQRM